ncbi:Uma2 family endonuclease [Leptolyngbya iicbica]|uniref:Uma2 family endonuclease n=2 Tax=Cyanophyceae TaxID=3028117 RepID=A0A4Q7EAU6_9CYAN|nr:Uma2 family endonuclease [Leptolyngbya sp. LK]RZM79792.1 Uma2 family endonuclease [Leptolyngbya sp. LK]
MRTLTQWSVADYHQMRDLGILDRRRCELIQGEIWDMAPEGQFHRFVNHRGVAYLRQQMSGKAEVFEAHPITLSTSEPQPDIAIVRLPDTRYLTHHPYPEDIYWLVEIADTTLTYDLETKRRVYAAAGIPEYWVIDIANRQLVVFKDGQNGDFVTRQIVSGGVIYPVAFPEVAIAVDSLISIPEL